MKIAGMQKMTLLDYPGKVACTVFLAGCNFRCPFCHNSELITDRAPRVMTDEALFAFLERRRGVLDAVCISGGEPTLQSDLAPAIRRIRELGYLVKLDTNGYRPDVLKNLVGEGLLDCVAMDIKNSPDRYAQTAGVTALDLTKIIDSIRFLLSGAVDYEFRTTVVRELHDEDSFRGIARLLQALAPAGTMAKRYFLQPFADRDTVAFSGLHAPDVQQLRRYEEILHPVAERVEIRG